MGWDSNQPNHAFLEKYTGLLDARFMPESFDVAFNADAVKTINQWCSDNTRGEIKEIVTTNDMSGERRMMILSAVYFKARWENVFDASETKPEWFRHADGSVNKTSMMNKKTMRGWYYEASGFKALRMDYDGNAHMLVLLPDGADGLPELESTLTPKVLDRIDNRLKSELVNVKIPRFSFNFDLDAIPTLEQMGIESAFDPEKADFSKMTAEQGFYIDFMRQKAVVKVDEEGTTAAAMMAMGGGFVLCRPTVFVPDP